MIICENCDKAITYNSYFKAYYCSECGGIYRDIKKSPPIQELLGGKVIVVNKQDLDAIIESINLLDINTLMIQKSKELYYIKVDDKTIDNLYKGMV